MKLITLNTWGGRVHRDLLDFFEKKQGVDIFCLQEVYNDAKAEEVNPDFKESAFNLFLDIQRTLPEHKGYFRPHIQNWYGLAIFVKENVKVNKEGDIFIHDADYTGSSHHSRNLQYVEILHKGEVFNICNVHGLWNGKGKGDTKERIIQSRKIKKFTDSIDKGKKIICGDFNLNPGTFSLEILEQNMINLIKKYSIKSTRTSFYNKPGKFADYVLISPDLEIKDFKVLSDEVSDHSAIYLEFD